MIGPAAASLGPKETTARGYVVMPVRLTNRSLMLLTVELNSGDSVHLAPDETSTLIDEREVDDNRWVAKLEQRDALAVERAGPPKPAARTKPKAKAKGGAA
jgi:hypothetical protein